MAERVTVASLVEAGFEVVEANGLSGLTMRDVADRLGVKAPAIYWHLKSRGDLIDEMATEMWREVFRRVTEQAAGLSPVEALVIFAHLVRSQALAQRDGARLLAGSYLSDDTLLRDQHRRLEEAGSHAEQRRLLRAYTLVYSFVIGYVIEEQARRQDPERYSPARRANRLGSPEAVELSAQVLDTSDERFEDLLGLLMATVRRDLA